MSTSLIHSYFNNNINKISHLYETRSKEFSGFDFSPLVEKMDGFKDEFKWGVTERNNIVFLGFGPHYRQIIDNYIRATDSSSVNLNSNPKFNPNSKVQLLQINTNSYDDFESKYIFKYKVKPKTKKYNKLKNIRKCKKFVKKNMNKNILMKFKSKHKSHHKTKKNFHSYFYNKRFNDFDNLFQDYTSIDLDFNNSENNFDFWESYNYFEFYDDF